MKPVVAPIAYLLISHGSRDPRPQEAMNRLADLMRRRFELDGEQTASSDLCLSEEISGKAVSEGRHASVEQFSEGVPSRLSISSGEERQILEQGNSLLLTRPKRELSQAAPSEVIVGTACLELAPIPLNEQIYEFALRLEAAGIKELKLLPMFLMSGVHVMEDIPTEVEAAQQKLKGVSLQLTLCPHLGSHSKISDVLASRLASVPTEGSLLVAHGSRRPKGNQAIKGLAKRLGTNVAYWATPPDIETQVIDLMQQGCQKLTILPYFLFAGGITDAIVHRTEELAERFPKVNFRLLPTLGATDEIASLAMELVRV